MKIGELIFIGMGLGGEEGMSIAALNALKDADLIYVENYTGLVPDSVINNLETLIGSTLTPADRETVEDGTKLLEAARDNNSTVLLTIGDPMTATTHIDLKLRAVDMGIPTRIIHGSSILSAAPGLCGLQHYKFGRTTTLAFPQGNYFPQSPYNLIAANLDAGLHTLVLLELTTDEGRIMSASDGLKVLKQLEARLNRGYIKDDTLVCVVARAGSNNSVTRAGFIKDMVEDDFGEPMHCLIIPGKLHFKEAEALVKLCGAPSEIMTEEAD
jgi:diphthine synthase